VDRLTDRFTITAGRPADLDDIAALTEAERRQRDD
jgi:hypothetical protein